MFQQQDFQPLGEDTQSDGEAIRESVRETIHKVRESLPPSNEFAQTPKSSSELAAHFGCTKESIQDWFKVISQAYCWLPAFDLKFGIGKKTRYTTLCIEQMYSLKASRESGQTADEWIDSIHEVNSEAIAIWETAQQPQPEPETEPDPQTSTLARFVETDESPFNGLSIITKATDKREALEAELVEVEFSVDADFEAFMTLSNELVTQDEAAVQSDELEFLLLRKRNAAKWLKRKAILEADKQQILQGNVLSKSPVGNGASASA